MWIDLQGLDDRNEQRRGRLAAVLPEPAYRFMVEPDAASEAALDGSVLPEMPLPTPEEYDLRRLDRALFERLEGKPATRRSAALGDHERESAVGSNNWAVAGARAKGGGALVANDMHLGLNVPNIWYRARLVVAPAGLDVTGVSLPGVPAIVAGSNRHVAWGFTNSYGDFQDLVRLERGPTDDTYLAPGGPRPFERETETLEVAHGKPESLVVRKTIWGPVIGDDGEGHALALAWTAHRPGATDMSVMHLERARNLDEAAAIIGGAGMPGQNVMIADTAGRIGWVLSGRLPRRAGIDPLRPSPWNADGAGWDGWVPQAESPRLLDPPQGYAWSANARVVGGEAYARIGDGDYAPAARARQIRDRLASLPSATPADMLAIQLDDRAEFAAHWQPILEQALRRAGEAEAARLVAGWSGHAAVDDAGYRLRAGIRAQRVGARLRSARGACHRALAGFSLACAAAFHRCRPAPGRGAPAEPPRPAVRGLGCLARRRREEHGRGPAEAMRGSRVMHLGQDQRRGDTPPDQRRPCPCSRGFLDMPAEPLPGDWSMPRVQSPDSGASERFSVSPGRETEGYLHMPGGQSGHPLSPFYRAGHADWVAGRATPFLPGAAAHVLKLAPGGEL